jgi:hypothetical protein
LEFITGPQWKNAILPADRQAGSWLVAKELCRIGVNDVFNAAPPVVI